MAYSSSKIISEMLPEIQTIEKCDFLKLINSFSNNLILCYTQMDGQHAIFHPQLYSNDERVRMKCCVKLINVCG